MRAVTLATLARENLKTLGGLVPEWKKMMRSDAVPILAVSLAHRDFLRSRPTAAADYVRAVMDATQFGVREPARASAILSRTANLDQGESKSYVALWNQIYMARLEPADVATLKTMAEIFRKNGTVEGAVPAALFNTTPYEQAKRTP